LGEGLKCKGRPRKPLAEVILKCAPLRATSSATKGCIPGAILKCLKILMGSAEAPGRNCRQAGKNYEVSNPEPKTKSSTAGVVVLGALSLGVS